VQEAKAEALAVGVSSPLPKTQDAVYDATVAPYYISVVFTRKGTGIKTLDDLKGKSFNFVDPASTSGHLAPKTLLIKNGLNPDKDMQTVFAGSHPTSVLSVYNGKAPAGATYEGNLVNLAASGQIKWCNWPDGQINKIRTAAEIKATYDACPDGSIAVLAQSDPIPNTPFAVRQDLPQSFKDAVRKALLSVKDDAELVKTRRSWYVDPHEELHLASLDAFYNPLRDIAKLLNLNLKELQ
jgi:phosphonate transport system substrate-binding protein